LHDNVLHKNVSRETIGISTSIQRWHNGLIGPAYTIAAFADLLLGKKRAEGKSPTAVGYAYFTHNTTEGKQFQYPI
jgi:hypothetical protein